MLNRKKIELFFAWFIVLGKNEGLALESNAMNPNLPECMEVMFKEVNLQLSADLMESFLDLDDEDITRIYPQVETSPCPISYSERQTLKSIFKDHLKTCQQCRYLNSVTVGDCIEVDKFLNRAFKNFS